MSKYTPGPWVVNGSRVESQDGALVAGVYDGSLSDCSHSEIEHANAALIAAAPALLAALEYVMRLTNPHGDDQFVTLQLTPDFFDPIRKILSKARGEA